MGHVGISAYPKVSIYISGVFDVRKSLFFVLMFVCVMVSSAAFAADVAITSVGQSSDGMMVKVLMKKLNIEPEYDALMKPEALKGQGVLIAVVGGSSKGLGAAGINKEEEKARGVAVIEAARKKGMKVIVMHVGGEGRRGDLSDMFITAVTKLGDRVIVVKSGNADKIFDRNKAPEAKLDEVDNIQAAVTPLEEALKEYGAIR